MHTSWDCLLKPCRGQWGGSGVAVGSQRREAEELEQSHEEGSGAVDPEDLEGLNVKFCLIFITSSSFFFSSWFSERYPSLS